MRICSIVNSLTTGGAEVLVAALSAEFARLGDCPLVIALCDAKTLGNSLETEKRMAREIETAGGEYVSLGLSASRNPLTGGQKLKGALKDFLPHIVHAHTVRALPMAAFARSSAPVLLTHHNTKLPFPPWMFRVCDLMTHGYVAIGNEVENILNQHARKPIVRIPNAASRLFKAGDPRKLGSGPKSILSVGAISQQKNYGLLIEVAEALRQARSLDPLPQLRVAGAGSELSMLQASVNERGLDKVVEFLGERSDVPDLMRQSDLYLNVSLYEGMPLTLLEAMASGLPIVASDVPGNRELVEDGVNGAKAALGDAKAIAEAVTTLLSNSDLYARLSKGAIAKSADYSIERCAERHRELYSSLAAQSNRSAHPPK